MDYNLLCKLCQEYGLKGKEAREFIAEERAAEAARRKEEALEKEKERVATERRAEREALEKEKEREAIEKRAEREDLEKDKEREYELKRMELAYQARITYDASESFQLRAKVSKIPLFTDGMDDMGNHLERFERLEYNEVDSDFVDTAKDFEEVAKENGVEVKQESETSRKQEWCGRSAEREFNQGEAHARGNI